ncbi:MAG: hypothetical protein KGK08_06980 [Acidobacteriota bacterium]|nr:hypothetical protein [Acidobacteriota bacterium]
MTKLDLLKLLIGQARANGFAFRRWYVTRLGLEWISAQHALETLASGRVYYALLFSHEFAQHFWKSGEEITFQVERQTFPRTRPDGSITVVHRKPYTRRTAREDVWRYHLRELALVDEPLRYMKRFLRVADELAEDSTATPRPFVLDSLAATAAPPRLGPASVAAPRTRPAPDSVPAEVPQPHHRRIPS